MTARERDPVEAAERSMDDKIRELEHESEELAHEIESSRKGLEELRHRQGAAGEDAGARRETDDEAGGDDAEGAGRPA